ncbi:cerebral peptide 1-like [Lineus longissimus]|uniref:cerebral peptide 1-like n=1 Tax=Lineus longissimus TaxID=88925 RepID=UPI002B4EF9A0
MKLYIAITLVCLLVFEIFASAAAAETADQDMDKRAPGWGKRGWGKRDDDSEGALDDYLKRGWGKRGWGKRGWGKRGWGKRDIDGAPCEDLNQGVIYYIYKAVEAEAQRINACASTDN